MIVLQPPVLCEGWGGHSLCLSGDNSVLMDLHWPCSCAAQSSILSIGSVSVALLVRHFPERSWTVVTFPCFTVVVFHQLVCPLTVVLPQIFFFSLHCSPIQFSLAFFDAPLYVVVHFPVFLRSFRLKCFLSHFSPFVKFVAYIKKFCYCND